MFYEHVYPNLRKNWNGAIQGFGIREVPRDGNVRAWIIEKLKSNRT